MFYCDHNTGLPLPQHKFHRLHADCAILLSQDTCVMIDTGEEQDAEHILTLLEQEQVEKIDCLILTHPDKDHIGGLYILSAPGAQQEHCKSAKQHAHSHHTQ